MRVAPQNIPPHPVLSPFACLSQGGKPIMDWLEYEQRYPWITYGAWILPDGSWEIECDGIPMNLIGTTFEDWNGETRSVKYDGRRKVIIVK